MEKDFHYNLIFSIAKMVELPKPDIIAYSSQYVDDNNRKQYWKDEQEAQFPRKIPVNGGNYYPAMTQSLSTKALDIMVQKYVYIPFHFLPGDRSTEINGKTNPFCTTPNSDNAKKILDNALQSDDPYLLGIALHTFADTWSHQNFTGFNENWNAIYPQYNFFKKLTPNIGHAEALHSPDIISEPWIDYRIGKQIKNKQRAFEATGEIYKVLRNKSGTGPYWTHVRRDYKKVIYASDSEERIELIDQLLNDNHHGPAPEYDERAWIDSALKISSFKIEIRDGLENTDWHRFQRAAKVHLAGVMDLLKEL